MDSITFPPGDKENPRHWPLWRKWSIVIVIILVDLSVSWTASGFSPASTEFSVDFGVSSEVATLGLSLTVLGFALGPMTLAPLSEYFGRSPVYIVVYGVFLLFLLGTALVQNLGGFLVLRLLAGLFCSVTIANFGGTIADLWPHNETGLPMSFFLWAATCGSPSGYFLFAFVAQTRGWRAVFWALFGICGGFWVLMTLVLKETRHTTILRTRVKAKLKLQVASGSGQQDLEPDETKLLEHRSTRELFRIALTRPFRFLFTESIVIFCAAFNGYLYGLSFLFNEAFSLVFGAKGHGFNIIGVGLAFLGIVVGISFGPVTNLWQERYYQRRTGGRPEVNIPEARVQLGQVAAVVLPLSLFAFSWTTYSSLPWIVPILFSAFWGWSFYTLILMTYMYTEDSYNVYSASALAGLGLIRNLFGAGFPLFSEYLFGREGLQWGGSILAFLALGLVPIPFVLARYGERLRARSPWAKGHMEGVVVGEGREGGDVVGGEKGVESGAGEEKVRV